MKTKELMTANEILINNNLNFTVKESSLYDNEGRVLPEYKAIQREDTGRTFQVSKKGYTIIQNHEALSLLDEIVESGLAKYSGARSYKNGGVVMIRADVPLDYVVAGEEIKTYIHVITSHNGMHSTSIIAHQQRAICKNILNAGLRGMECYSSFKHTTNYRMRIDEAKIMFEKYRAIFARQKEAFQKMANTQMNSLRLDSFLDELFKIDKEKEISTRIKNQREEVERLFTDGIGHNAPNVCGTEWAAYNAVTEYVDHKRGTDANREYASMFGSGAAMREKAYAILTR